MTSKAFWVEYTICLLSILVVWTALAKLGPAWGGSLLEYRGCEGREITKDKSTSGSAAYPVCKWTDSKTARVIAVSEWCIIPTCPSVKLLINASGSQANISARQHTVLFKYICLSSPGVELSIQHCINCTGIQNALDFWAILGKYKFYCSEGGRPEKGRHCCWNEWFGKRCCAGAASRCSNYYFTHLDPFLSNSTSSTKPRLPCTQ